ncbi:protein SPMIP1 [Meriones unguiculatus]|uniref:protein SPMIP1 n=1 Tax=Meriones unguiculatus TaxID=10047 RepID=UPI00293E817F|nr:protein SPMIP1 [Meriones unguiculatus]
MRDVFNPQNHAYFGNIIRKEVAARTAWTIRYGHKYLREASGARKQPQQAPFGSVSKACPAPSTGPPVRKKEGWSEARGVRDQLFRAAGVQGNRVQQVRIAPQHRAPQGRPEDLKMKHPTPATLKLLFQGTSHDGQGRTMYLKERNRLKPEEKYKYPMVSSWEYGWHVGDVMENYKNPAFARTYPITKSFYNKNGIFHIPRRSDNIM